MASRTDQVQMKFAVAVDPRTLPTPSTKSFVVADARRLKQPRELAGP